MNNNQKNKLKFVKKYKNSFYKNLGSGRKFGNTSFSPNAENIRISNVSQSPNNMKLLPENCPYFGWNLYFFGQEFYEESLLVQKIKIVEKFLEENLNLFDLAVIEKSLSFSLDINILCNDQHINLNWKDFESDLKNNPTQTISCFGLAMHQLILTKKTEKNTSKLLNEQDNDLPMIHLRIFNFKPVLQLKNLKSNYFGKLISVKGTVIRVGNIKLTCTWMTFQCEKCDSLQCYKQTNGIYSRPTFCLNKRCKSKSFTPVLSSPFTKTLNFQCIRLQEIVLDENKDGGRVPRSIDCELSSDVVESCSPGDVAIITGIIKMRNTEDGTKHKYSNIFQQYIEVVSVSNIKEKNKGSIPGIEISEKNYFGIKEIVSDKNVFRLLVQSLCPAIFGHEMVKAGLILAMFGGCQRYENCRANPHVLIVGDPGLGKSQMLQACASAAPRGVYVCGNTSTSSGLTVTLARDNEKDFVLEAGALVLSDHGCCCIDEFDKMSSQHQALLEAMEQQTVSIAKSGVVCALPCRTSILAAANPVGGHYSKAKTVSENLKLGPSLLSRFDLVFILLDQPSVKTDSMLSDHVIAMHSGIKENTSTSSFFKSFADSPLTCSGTPLLDKLKIFPAEELNLIPHQLLRKYIAYAKQYVKPKLTKEASEILMKFYMELRKFHQDSTSTPVTTRQLESLIRFTEARAKLELREQATAKDAQDVVEILRHSLLDMFVDEFGNLDFMRSQNGSGMSTKNQAKQFIQILERRSELQCKSVFTVQELKEIAQLSSVKTNDFSNFLSALNVQGYLLKKGSNLYQLLTVD